METLKNIPEGYQHVMPYLIVKNAQAFLGFMQAVFGAEERYKAYRMNKALLCMPSYRLKAVPLW